MSSAILIPADSYIVNSLYGGDGDGLIQNRESSANRLLSSLLFVKASEPAQDDLFTYLESRLFSRDNFHELSNSLSDAGGTHGFLDPLSQVVGGLGFHFRRRVQAL